MDEFTLINKIKQSSYRQSSLLKGVGDDAAVFRMSQGDLVTATDVFVENVHFSRKTMNPKQIGYRALAVNFSDLAAMGAEPMFYLVSIVVPERWKQEIQSIFMGMDELASEYQADLIGGDTVSGEDLMISINVIGRVDQGRARYRHEAKPGDLVFVTGTLGDSRAGLHILQSDQKYEQADYFIKRHRYPTPRIHFSLGLRDIDRIALNDISDGIVSEAAEIAEASEVNLILEEESLPVSKAFEQFTEKERVDWKLYGGEDFELLAVTAEENWASIKDIAKETDTRVTRIGYVEALEEESKDRLYLVKKGKRQPISKRGYRHLT